MGFACLCDRVTVGNNKDVVDGMISLVGISLPRRRSYGFVTQSLIQGRVTNP